MYPRFTIYQSILSGSLQPWLSVNGALPLSDRLLQRQETTGNCWCSAFFSRLTKQTGLLQEPQHKEFRREAGKLPAYCGCGGNNPFLSLPATGSGGRFYTLLTGYSFQNYEEWIHRQLAAHCSSATGRWIHYRLVELLYGLLHVHFPGSGFPTGQLLIACRVKAAAAVLLQRLMTRMPVNGNGFHARIYPREELESALDACHLELPARQEVITLYDRTIPATLLPAPSASEAAISLPHHDSQNPPAVFGEHHLHKLAKVIEEDSRVFHEMVQKMLDKPSQPDGNQRVDSATACRILGISRKKLQRMRNHGEMPFINLGNKYFYLMDDINHILRERSNKKKLPRGT